MSANDKSDNNLLNDKKEDTNEDMIDDDLVLSEHSLNALKQFYEENDCNLQNNGHIEENWQLSQFWYSEETAHYLSEEVIHAINGLTERKSIACISCPTLFDKLFDKLQTIENNSINLTLFEFDRRFETKYPLNFVYYDYNQPIDDYMRRKFSEHSFDIVIADPPFLSEDCMNKVMETIKYLTEKKVLICSGAVMRDILEQRLQLQQCQHFIPKHNRQLGNEFRCFSNFPLRLCSNQS